MNSLGRLASFHEAATAHEPKHRSQGPPGSVVYNPTARKEGKPGKHARNYHDAKSKSYSGPGKHSAGYTGKRRTLS